MNFADYLSELLGQHDEVSVPGLGCFVRERINGYYNDKEARFYPPYHQVKFVPQPKDDDDTFAQYVADKKNISLASSKYFAEKFISKLREDAARSKYLFADLGSFQVEQEQLVFKPNDKIPADPAFYGYPPINIYKAGQQTNGGIARPAFPETVQQATVPVAAAATPFQPIPSQPQYFEEEPEKKGINIWLIIIICIAAVALALFGVYKFYPAVFDKVTGTYHNITNKDSVVQPVVRHEIKVDTAKKATATVDTTAKTTVAATPAPAQVVNAADTVKQQRFEIIEGSFRKLPSANTAVRYLKNKGVDAKILTDAPGPLLKISVGTYPSHDEAEAARLALINSGKISKKSYTIPIQK
jgi:hypothetical protein